MSEVSCRACQSLVEVVREQGHDPSLLVEGLGFDLEHLARPTERVLWTDFVTLVERTARELGGEDALRDAAANRIGSTPVRGVRYLVRPLGSPRPLYRLGAFWFGRRFFPMTRAQMRELSPGRIWQRIDILPTHRDSPEFFAMIQGLLEGTPTVIAYPRAVVQMKRGERFAEYEIELPPSPGWVARLRGELSRRSGVGDAMAELQLGQRELEAALAREREKSAALERAMQERRRTEEQLRQAQKMEAVGLLAGGLAHEFSNVLTAIGAYADLARTDAEDATRGHLDEITLGVTRGAGVVKRLLAFSRRQMVMPEPLDLNALLFDLEPMLRAMLGERVDLGLDPAPSLPAVRADRGQIEQVIVNLAVNARDAMPRGGRLRLETRALIDAGGRRVVRLAVSDDGIGMDDETRRRVFEPFFTTKPSERGTGLGLFTVWGIVQQHEGTIEIHTEVDKGTRFEIDLPPLEGDSHPAPPRVRSEQPRGGRETLLLLEDEPQVRSVTAKLLRDAGYTVLAASDAAEALTHAERHVGSVDLVVSDVVLPGIDGRDVVRRLRRARPTIGRVLFVSGHADELPGELPLPHGFLRKPFSRDELLRKIRELLDD